jgi:class 3 adenylate cyclase
MALFCDYVGSTGLGERLDSEALRNVQASYFDRMRSVVQRFGGTRRSSSGTRRSLCSVFPWGTRTTPSVPCAVVSRCETPSRD